MLPDIAVEGTDVLCLPGLLDSNEIQGIFDCARKLAGEYHRGKQLVPRGANATATACAHDVKYGKSHVALNLHRGGAFTSICPTLCAKLTTTMRSQPHLYISPQIKLNLRCVEFHTCTRSAAGACAHPRGPTHALMEWRACSGAIICADTSGDGLSTQGHRDMGSILTMSVLLSEPDSVQGGTFTTCDRGDGQPWFHTVGKGDAILFHSEKMHNVVPLTEGIRHALVIELWLHEENHDGSGRGVPPC